MKISGRFTKSYQIYFIFIILYLPQTVFGFESWWQCSGKVGGEWNFARTPSVCLVDHMQTQSFVNNQYSSLIFDDGQVRTTERNRYMTELNATLKATARYYLLRRKPNISEAEIEAFAYGLQALLHQETYWSHYRKTSDGKVRYMRGDVGHGHGIMQVDDRSHQTVLLQGKGADLVHNMIYGLDVFYSAWEKAATSSCVSSPTNYKNRIRAAWSAYNGGPSKICRWVSQTGTYAAHDKDFLLKLDEKKWLQYVKDQNKKSSIDIECLSEGQRPCAPPSSETQEVVPQANKLYKSNAGHFCLFKSGQFECVDRLNDVNCLQARENNKFTQLSNLSESFEKKYKQSVLDRHQLCKDNIDGLIAVANVVKLNKTINLRKTPSGELIKAVSEGKHFQILDFEVLTTEEQKRYYKIRDGLDVGYVYAGDKSSFLSWGEETLPVSIGKMIANVGDTIKIIAPYGINLRQSMGGSLISTVGLGEELEVSGTLIQGSKNYLYYKVIYKGKTGYLYSGYVDAPSTVNLWTQVIDYDKQQMRLISSIPYRYLRSCAKDSCSYTSYALRSVGLKGSLPDLSIVLQVQGSWSYVENLDGSKKGWILTNELELVVD